MLRWYEIRRKTREPRAGRAVYRRLLNAKQGEAAIEERRTWFLQACVCRRLQNKADHDLAGWRLAGGDVATHHRSSRRGRIARAGCRGCHKATRMQCGMRSDGVQATVTLHLASPQRVDSLEIEDGRRHGSERTCDLHHSPATRTDLLDYLAANTHMSECMVDAIGVSVALGHSFFALSCHLLTRNQPDECPESRYSRQRNTEPGP